MTLPAWYPETLTVAGAMLAEYLEHPPFHVPDFTSLKHLTGTHPETATAEILSLMMCAFIDTAMTQAHLDPDAMPRIGMVTDDGTIIGKDIMADDLPPDVILCRRLIQARMAHDSDAWVTAMNDSIDTVPNAADILMRVLHGTGELIRMHTHQETTP